MLGLNIKLHSFEFFGNLVSANDTLRVSITTLPDGQKQAFTFNAKKMTSTTASFTIKFSECTENIVIVFRKQNILSSDHIFASTCIHSSEFPQLFNKIDNIAVQKINIYEPKQHNPNSKNNNLKDKNDRKVIGNMIAQFSLLEKFSRQDYSNGQQESKNNNQIDTSKVDSILKKDNMLFQDLILN